MKKKTELPKDKVIVITIVAKDDKSCTIKCDHSDMDTSEIIGVLEQVKYGFLTKTCVP